MRTVKHSLTVAVLLALTGCTYASYGDAKIISVMQKRTLTVKIDDGGELRYSSGSDPIIIQTPYGAIEGSREQ